MNTSSSRPCLWKKKQLVTACYNTTSVLLKITQFTYKTFKWNKLLTWSRCCKLNTFYPASICEEKLAILPKYVRADTNSLFLSVYSAWRETHLALKYLRREWKDGRDACRGHSFYPGHGKEKHWHRWRGRCDIFCSVIPHIFKLMPCLK